MKCLDMDHCDVKFNITNIQISMLDRANVYLVSWD